MENRGLVVWFAFMISLYLVIFAFTPEVRSSISGIPYIGDVILGGSHSEIVDLGATSVEKAAIEQPKVSIDFPWKILALSFVVLIWGGILVWLFFFRKKKNKISEEVVEVKKEEPVQTPVDKETEVSAPSKQVVEGEKKELPKDVSNELPW